MKKYLILTIAIMMFVAVVAATAEAQVFGTQRIRARIPFAFSVGEKSLPAGEYTIAVLNPTSGRKVLQIRSTDGRSSAIIQTNEHNVNTPEQAKLVFNRYGDRYFFAQAQMAGDSTTLAAVKSNVERNTEQTVASKGGKATIAIIAG
ncbi:MAG: hypothetical protein LC794_12725 [Acidobacteria bacterium]|nr:hypothetical protein [Acidobacteriota bacterium]MCA1627534.1 hypothetical protein [Acidobacteriota bacterium]